MNSAGSETLERIQREIQENLEKEDERKKELERLSNCSENGSELQNYSSLKNNIPRVNGVLKKQVSLSSEKGSSINQNGNLFVQNGKTKGMMHRFLKSKGKLVNSSKVINGNSEQTKDILDFTYQPPRITSETGNLSRNGFVPAEIKMRNEVKEFQRREIELRQERRKSQPELMALLKLEEDNDGKDEGFTEFSCSSSTSSASDMKSARSLADLCNTPEEELDTPGTHNLILQFENLKV